MSTSHPPFAYSLFIQPSTKGTLAYKVLGARSQVKVGQDGQIKKPVPLVLVHGLSAVGLVDWLPLAEKLAQTRPGQSAHPPYS
ncbi:hypothetical protein P7C70_g3386, partial [Phenoliferia sp. Uapishka_3]